MPVWSGRPRPLACSMEELAGEGARATRSILALRGYRHPGRLGSRARHGCDSRTLRRGLRRSSRGLSLRLRWSSNQSQSFTHFRVQLRHSVFVVFEELAGVFAALADALAFVAEPRAGFLENVVVHRDIEQIAFARNAFAVEDVELGFAERCR